ncbi:hypothetical protein SAY86_021516 [Trapa natans]|uniref:Uncharacterized protein n=1 Tax=Trapa natans TaxID=22666 RepID=A0AAN7M9X0_TRANT|nr:hypothetical protein SAY86_021516 [Trapa natans]
MAVVPISYRDQRHFLQYLTRQRELGGRCIRTSEIFSKAYLRLALLENAPCRRKVQIVCRANGDSTNQVQLRVLDAYFRKFQDGARLSSGVVDRKMEFTEQTNELKSKQGLQSLDAYPGKDTKSEEAALPRFNQMSTLADGSAIPFSDEDNATRIGWQKPKLGVKGTDVEEKPGISQTLSQIDEASDLYLIGIIASLNIAVFLFEIASPIRSPGMGPFSIPMLYGAKINGLILSGEWWRLVTPMFLVQD